MCRWMEWKAESGTPERIRANEFRAFTWVIQSKQHHRRGEERKVVVFQLEAETEATEPFTGGWEGASSKRRCCSSTCDFRLLRTVVDEADKVDASSCNPRSFHLCWPQVPSRASRQGKQKQMDEQQWLHKRLIFEISIGFIMKLNYFK